MSTTTYHPTAQPAISDALGELATATRHLLAAVVASLTARQSTRPTPGNRTDEAAEARGIADHWARTDPRVAADIYCAADRHEMGG
jgi:hypothetical protein